MPDADAPDEAILRARALIEQGRAAEALHPLLQLAASHGDHPEVWSALGLAHGMLDRDAEAETAFRRAAQLQPDSRDARLNVALCLGYQGKLRESIDWHLAARRIDPQNRSMDDTLMWVLLSVLQDEPGAPAGAPPELPPLDARCLVSVVVPTKDRPAMLRDALESIARQQYPHWEAVVVNDGGQGIDRAVQTLPADAARRIRVVDLPASLGTAGARNRALQVARGSLIAFLDDDDLYLPGHLEALVAGMAASGAAFGYTQSVAVEEAMVDGRRVTGRRGELRDYRYSRAILKVRNVIPTACWGVRRECFDLCGAFDESLPCAEDWDLLLRFSERFRLHRIPAVTAEIRVRTGAADSVTRRTRLRPMCELFYRRYPSGGHELIELGREIYLAAVD